MRRWMQRTHLAGFVALTITACARGEHVPVRGGIAVTDDAGRRVTLAAPARRIVSVLLDLNLLEQLGPAPGRLGVLTGHSRAADSLVHVLDNLASQPPAPSTRSLAFIVWDNPPIVIGAGSYLDRLAALAGARNVFHDVGAPSAQVSIETIAARDPDVVGLLSDSAVPPRYAMRPQWRVVRAVRNARFLFLPGQLFGRPGPRAAEAIRELRRRLEAAR